MTRSEAIEAMARAMCASDGEWLVMSEMRREQAAALEAENARLREALESCADLTNRFLWIQREKVQDVASIARAALGDSEGES